jgi:hypothetical protein
VSGGVAPKRVIHDFPFQVPVGIDDIPARDRATPGAAICHAIASRPNLYLNGMAINADIETAAGVGGWRAIRSGFFAGDLFHRRSKGHFSLVGRLQVADQSEVSGAQGYGRYADDGQECQHEQSNG